MALPTLAGCNAESERPQTSSTFLPAANIPPASRSFLMISSGVCRFIFMMLDRAVAQPNLTIHGSVCGEHSEGSRERYLTGTSWERCNTPCVESLRILRSLGLSAVVHIQKTDIKPEYNKWRTLDRAVSKIPAQRLRSLHQRLNQTPPVLIPLPPMVARDQADSAFEQHQISLPVERSFNLEPFPANVVVRVGGAGTDQIYLNDQLVREMSGRDRKGYPSTSLALPSPNAHKALRLGTNVFRALPSQPTSGEKKQKADSEPTKRKAASVRAIDTGLFEVDFRR